jgi:hypothetical protein
LQLRFRTGNTLQESKTMPQDKRGVRRRIRRSVIAAACFLLPWLTLASTGEELYLAACSACHAVDGRGSPDSVVGFTVPIPDFTDCDFASREPDGDWISIAHEGGPTRGFSHLMPAFGEAMTVSELELAMSHIRTFCRDDAWPRGELNLPRALHTEKAFPEDEAVLTATYTEGALDAFETKITYEQRFGARNQFELVIPLGWLETVSLSDPTMTEWRSSVGDIAVGVKRAFWHNHERGAILSVTGEVILPTGDDEAGFGKGTVVFEPFLSYGQLLPANFFLHGQAGFELPLDTDEADRETFLRAAIGRTFTQGPWGRAWSPMVELLGSRDLESGAETSWDVVPQFQVTLNRRQHVMLAVGVRTPMTDSSERDTRYVAYLLWDWFDGGLFDGW